MTVEEATYKLGLMVGIIIDTMETDDRFPHDPKAQRSVAVIKESWETLTEFLNDDYELPTLP
jgi:hypothetical protein